LAYLLLHQERPQARTHLAYTFWPETSDSQARTNLRRELHQLRQTFPFFEQYVQSDGQNVQWSAKADCRVDALEFTGLLHQVTRTTDTVARQELYQQAIGLYQGDLLPGLYDDWVLAKREALRQAFIQLLEELTRLLVAERAYASATSLTQRLLQVDPLYEAGYTQLMELYALQDDRAHALHTYHTCATILERELGVPPGEATEALYQRLLRADTSAVRERIVTSTSLQLVGRKAEWQTMLTSWRRASQGRARLLLIEGEAGIGKTRLGEELLDWAHRQSIPTARTRSYAAEGRLAYAPVIEWLRSDALHPGLAMLAPAWRSEVARLLPELLSDFPGLPAPEPLTERWQRQRLFEALARAVTVDNRPRVLLIDDLQWCDQETLEWLRFLFRFAPTAPLLVLGTVRSEEVEEEHPLHALTRELRTGEQATVVELSAFSPAETSQLAAQIQGRALDEAAANHLFTASEGNPLFVVEMVRAGLGHSDAKSPISPAPTPPSHLSSTLPPKVYAVIQHRLAQLSSTAHTLAGQAATIGRAFTFDLLTAASDGSEDEVVSGLDELWRRRIIRERGANVYDFSHDRIRDVVYHELTPIRRRLLHRRAASGLVALYRDRLTPISARIAVHYEQAGMTEEAILWNQRAASAARSLFAATEAVQHYQRALALLQTLPQTEARKQQALGLLLPLSSELVIVYGFSSQEAMAVSAQARELSAYADGYQVELFYALRRMGDVNIAQGKAGAACELAAEILKIAERANAPLLLMEAHWLSGRAWLHLGQFVSAREQMEQAISLVSDLPERVEKSDSLPVLRCYLGVVQWLLGFPRQALTLVQKALSEVTAESDPFEKAKCYFMSKIVYRNRGDVAAAVQLEQASLRLGAETDMLVARLDGEIMLAMTATEETRSESITKLRTIIDQFLGMGYAMFTTVRLELLARLYVRDRQLERALDILQEALDLSAHSDENWWDAELHRLRGDILHQQGAPKPEVAACYQRAIEIAREQGSKSLELRAATSLATWMVTQGEASGAQRMLQEIYHWFSEGFETDDLHVAANLLNP
jgi:DNA-binding SARP family transcriptional activator